MTKLKPATPIRTALALGAVSGLLLFGTERLMAAQVHMQAQPGGGDLTLWLLATAALYGTWGLAVGGVAAAIGPIRRRPVLVPHVGAVTIVIAVPLLLPNWYAMLAAVFVSAFGTNALWWLARRRPWVLPAGLGVVAAAALALCLVHPRGLPAQASSRGEPAVDGAPDLVLVVLDTVRRDHVSAYGHPRETTPAFDRLARGGARLERATMSSPWSLPSHATLFSGLSPGAHGAHYERPVLDAGVPTLAALLTDHGYETVGVSGNPWLTPDNGTGRGFAAWHDSQPVRDLARCFMLRWLWADNLSRGKGGAASAERVEAVLQRRGPDDPPLFLFVNLFEAHAPYDAVPAACGRAFLPEDTSRRQVRRLSNRLELAQTAGTSYLPEGAERALADALYDGAVHCADLHLGTILEAVETSPRPTVTVVLSDHGEALGEHAQVGHTHGLWDLLIRVPMAVSYPGEILPGTVIEEPVRGVDLMPTMLDYAGVPPAVWPPMEGRSVRATLAGEPPPVAAVEAYAEHFVPVFILDAFRFARPAGTYPELNRRRRTVIQDGWRYEADSWGEERLYDLTADPGEQRDLLGGDAEPPRAGALRTALAAWIARTGGPWGAPPEGVPETELDEETIARLRALGYMR